MGWLHGGAPPSAHRIVRARARFDSARGPPPAATTPPDRAPRTAGPLATVPAGTRRAARRGGRDRRGPGWWRWYRRLRHGQTIRRTALRSAWTRVPHFSMRGAGRHVKDTLMYAQKGGGSRTIIQGRVPRFQGIGAWMTCVSGIGVRVWWTVPK